MAKLNGLGLGIALGLWWAVCVFLLGLASMIWDYATPLVNGLGTLYLGYAPNVLGSIVGAIWAFIDLFIFGILVAWIYNKFK